MMGPRVRRLADLREWVETMKKAGWKVITRDVVYASDGITKISVTYVLQLPGAEKTSATWSK